MPFHIEASRHWTLKSWDRTQIPKPFATVAIAIGEPFDVAADADEAALERRAGCSKQRLKALEARALDARAVSAIARSARHLQSERRCLLILDFTPIASPNTRRRPAIPSVRSGPR